MTTPLPEGVPVRVAVAGREVDGEVEDVRWTPQYNTRPREALSVAVDVGTGTIVASLYDLVLV
jgi:hypothetical protein